MAALELLDETGGGCWRVWPDPEPMPAGAVREAGSYLFRLVDCEQAATADLLIDDEPLEALRTQVTGSARWRWQPGFHAGAVQAELRLPGSRPRRFEVVTDPDLRKLSRDDFDAMVRDILADSFALFSLSGFRKSVARGMGGRPPAIARLEFLRSRIDEIEGVVQAISAHPRRRLQGEEIAIPYHRAARATGPEIVRSLRTGRVLRAEKGALLPSALKGHLPAAIRATAKRDTADLPEHRQIGACLRGWSSWLTAAAGQLERRGGDDAETSVRAAAWAARCRSLARRLSALAAKPPFDIGEPQGPAFQLTALFRNDARYRAFNALRQDMERGIAAVFGDFLDMPLARTWELYELWCFIRLIRASIEAYGPHGADLRELFIENTAGGITVAARAVSVTMKPGWMLCFQRSYREYWKEPAGVGSFSRTMAPDISLLGGPLKDSTDSRVIVLDAKYRIDEGLNDALSSIHTYRDALVRENTTGRIEGVVRASYLLTPQVPGADEQATFKTAAMPARLFRPDYRDSFKFGALTLRPGVPLASIVEALRTIIGD